MPKRKQHKPQARRNNIHHKQHKKRSTNNNKHKHLPILLLLLLAAIIGITIYVLVAKTGSGNLFGKAVTTTSTVNVNTCQALNQPNTKYVLASDIVFSDALSGLGGVCFTISASNIILDGAGHKVEYTGWGYPNPAPASAIYSADKSDVEIKNLFVKGFFSENIRIVGNLPEKISGITLSNVHIEKYGSGDLLNLWGITSSRIENVNVTSIAGEGSAIRIGNTADTTFINVSVYKTGTGDALQLSTVENSSFTRVRVAGEVYAHFTTLAEIKNVVFSEYLSNTSARSTTSTIGADTLTNFTLQHSVLEMGVGPTLAILRNVTILNSTITTRAKGLEFQGPISGVLLENNTITATNNEGLFRDGIKFGAGASLAGNFSARGNVINVPNGTAMIGGVNIPSGERKPSFTLEKNNITAPIGITSNFGGTTGNLLFKVKDNNIILTNASINLGTQWGINVYNSVSQGSIIESNTIDIRAKELFGISTNLIGGMSLSGTHGLTVSENTIFDRQKDDRKRLIFFFEGHNVTFKKNNFSYGGVFIGLSSLDSFGNPRTTKLNFTENVHNSAPFKSDGGIANSTITNNNMLVDPSLPYSSFPFSVTYYAFQDNIISKNNITGGATGLLLYGDPGPMSGNMIVDNNIIISKIPYVGATGRSIQLYGASNNTFLRNNITMSSSPDEYPSLEYVNPIAVLNGDYNKFISTKITIPQSSMTINISTAGIGTLYANTSITGNVAYKVLTPGTATITRNITFRPYLNNGSLLPDGSIIRAVDMSGNGNPIISGSFIGESSTLEFLQQTLTATTSRNYTKYNMTILTPDGAYSSFLFDPAVPSIGTVTLVVTNPPPTITPYAPTPPGGSLTTITSDIVILQNSKVGFGARIDDYDWREAVLYIDNKLNTTWSSDKSPPYDIINSNSFISTGGGILPDGSHTFRFEAVDAKGQKTISPTYSFTVDTSAPEIIIREPAHLGFYNSDIKINATITDTKDVASATYSFGRTSATLGSQQTLIKNGNSWGETIPITSLFEGMYILNITSTDTLGHQRSQTANFTLDKTPPTPPKTNDTLPIGGNTTGPSPGFNINTTDPSTASCVLTINSLRYNLPVIDGVCGSPQPPLNLSEGFYYYNITITDSAGNSYTTPTQNFTVDTTPPIISATSPLDGSSHSKNVPVTISVTDGTGVLSVTAMVFGGGATILQQQVSLTNTGTVWNGLFNSTGIPDERYSLTITAVDKVQNSRVLTQSFLVDRSQPIICGVTALCQQNNTPSYNLTAGNGSTGTPPIPPSNGVVNTSNPSFNFTIGDSSNVTCTLMIGTVTYTLLRNGSQCYLHPPVNLSDGNYNYTLNVTDGANNSVQTGPHNFSVDTKPPVLNMTTPKDPAVYPSPGTGLLLINFTVTDPHIQNVSAVLTNSTGGNTTLQLVEAPPGTWSVSINLTNLTEGNYTIKISTNDTLGHVTESITALIIDRTAPTIALLSPASDSSAAAGVITFSVNVTDANLNNLTLSINNNTTFHALTGGVHNLTRDLAIGTYSWNITAIDKIGNKNTSDTRSITITANQSTNTSTNTTPPQQPPQEPAQPNNAVTPTLTLTTPTAELLSRPLLEAASYAVPTLAPPGMTATVTSGSAISLACAAVAPTSPAPATITISPVILDKSSLPKGKTTITEPFTVNCAGETLDLTLSLPEAYKDITILTCKNGVCTQESSQPRSPTTLTCGEATLSQLSTTIAGLTLRTEDQKAQDIATGRTIQSGSFTLTKEYEHASSQNALILVHGIFGNKNTYQSLITEFSLLKQPWDIWVAEYDYNQPLETLGKELSALLEQFPNKKLYIAGHSLGGLVVQEALYQSAIVQRDDSTRHKELYNTRKVILIGVPNEGSPAAQVYTELDLAALKGELAGSRFTASQQTLQQLTAGKKIQRIKGVTYEVIAGTKPYTFTSAFFTGGKKNDGIVATTSAQNVGGTPVNNLCTNYYETPLTHTELNDNELIARLIARSVNSDIAKAKTATTAGYVQYHTLKINSCSPGTTYAILGTLIKSEEAYDPTTCSCGNGYCGAGETEDSCPSDCAALFTKSNIDTLFFPGLAYLFVTALAIITLSQFYQRFGKKEMPDSSVLFAGLITEGGILLYSIIQYLITGTASIIAYIISLLLTGVLIITLAGGASTKKADTPEEKPKRSTRIESEDDDSPLSKIELWK